MKTTKEIVGLRIISIADGTQVGHVKDLLLNAQTGQMEFLIIDQPSDYFGAKIIAFSDVLGVGEFAVTIPNPQVIQDVAQNPVVQELLKQDVRVIGTKVLTKKGQLIGEVEELFIDEDAGKISVCVYRNQAGQSLEISGTQVITYGKELLIVESNFQNESSNLLNTPDNQNTEEIVVSSSSKEFDSVNFESDDSFNLFEQRQLQYFIGKSVEKEIVLDNGETLAAGQTITEETIQKITKRNTLMEITSHLQKQ